MTLWAAVLVASGLAFVTKLAGHLVPARLLHGTRMRRVSALLPVALLSSLVVLQAFAATDGSLVFDARAVAVGAAVVALALRAPFVVVVGIGAVVAAGLRLLGWS
ncbi:MAG: branched-chain amino acid transporter AzlD [Actinomycetales bacterium]|nr:MAG: branched-chain amino acid transporter AzlD [Actinomycetales bacterium]